MPCVSTDKYTQIICHLAQAIIIAMFSYVSLETLDFLVCPPIGIQHHKFSDINILSRLLHVSQLQRPGSIYVILE